VHPDGTEDHQVGMDVAEQQLLPDWSPDGGRLVFTTRGGSTEPLYEYDLAKDESRQLINVPVPALVTTNPRTHQTVKGLSSSERSVHSREAFPATAGCG
jgi:Tol biopolymer transport system component